MLETQSFLKVKEVAERLNVGISTIYRLKDSGELPYYKPKGGIRFDYQDVENYLKKNRHS